jgi:hypothetical protein
MGEGLLLGLSWLDGSVSTVFSERKVVKVSSVLRCLSNHVEVNFFYLTSVWFLFVFIWSYKASGLPNIFGYYCEYCLFLVKILFPFLLVFVIFVSSMCLFVYYTCLLFVYFGCAGSVGTFLAGWVIYFVCV